MKKRAALPTISSCSAPVPRGEPLNENHIIQGILASLLIVSLFVGHVYLSFRTRDMNLQQSRLQEEQIRLRIEYHDLARQTTQLCDLGRLRSFAKSEMRMEEEPNPSQRVVATLSSGQADTYVVASAAANSEHAIVAGQDESTPLQKIIMSLVDVNKAFAAENDR